MTTLLEEKCSDYLQTLLNTHNVCLVFEQSLLFDQKDLVKKAEKIIQRNSFEVMQTKTFKNMAHSSLCAFLQIPSFSCAEIEVYKAVVQWAKAHAENVDVDKVSMGEALRNVLKSALHHIHFGSFSEGEYVKFIAADDVFSKSENDVILAAIRHRSESHIQAALPFTTTPRCKYQEVPIRYKFRSVYGMMQKQAVREVSLTFKPNKAIHLNKIGFELENYKRSEFELTIQVDGKVFRPNATDVVKQNFQVQLDDVKAEAGSVVKIELYVSSLLPITLTLQSDVFLETTVMNLNTDLKLDIVQHSRGAGPVFAYIDVTPRTL